MQPELSKERRCTVASECVRSHSATHGNTHARTRTRAYTHTQYTHAHTRMHTHTRPHHHHPQAVEHVRCDGLNEELLAPGTKVLLSNASVRAGVVMLQPKTIKVKRTGLQTCACHGRSWITRMLARARSTRHKAHDRSKPCSCSCLRITFLS